MRRHHFEGGYSVFEMADGSHHDHIVCVQCGLVKEFFDEYIEKRQVEVAEEIGFAVTDHVHTIYGVCKTCQKKQ